MMPDLGGFMSILSWIQISQSVTRPVSQTPLRAKLVTMVLLNCAYFLLSAPMSNLYILENDQPMLLLELHIVGFKSQLSGLQCGIPITSR